MKALYAPFVLLIAFTSGSGQTIYPKLGITGSVNTYSARNDEVDQKISFLLGVAYDVTLLKTVSMQIEVDYVQKAFQSSHEETTSLQVGEDIYSIREEWKHQYFISYIELPLLLKVTHDNFFILAGPAPGIGLGGSHKYDLHTTSSYVGASHESGKGKVKFNGETPAEIKDVHFDNRWDASLVVGAGAILFKKKLRVECRYELGMVNLYKDIDSKNRSLQILFSTPIKIGHNNK
jgi:hypothetical protein